MRKIVLICFLLASMFAKVHYNINDAKVEARYSLKPIFLIIYSTSCPHCERYFDDMKRDTELMRLIASGYVTCLLDIAKSDIPKNVPYIGKVPFTIVLDFNGKTITPPLNGRIPTNYLIEYLYQSRLLFNKLLESQYQ